MEPTILLSNDEATTLFMAVGTGEIVLIEQPCSLLLTCLFQLVNKLLQLLLDTAAAAAY